MGWNGCSIICGLFSKGEILMLLAGTTSNESLHAEMNAWCLPNAELTPNHPEDQAQHPHFVQGCIHQSTQSCAVFTNSKADAQQASFGPKAWPRLMDKGKLGFLGSMQLAKSQPANMLRVHRTNKFLVTFSSIISRSKAMAH